MASVIAQLPMLCLLTIVIHASGKTLRRQPSSSPEVAVADTGREVLAGKKLDAVKCEHSTLNQDDLQLGLRLGSQFLVRSQQPAGNFRYEYNWLSQTETEEDNPVRQAGTLWGLTLLHVDEPKSGLMPTIRKGLKYFEKHSVAFPGGVRLVLYPGQDPQKLGAVALLALAHIEVLRQPNELENAEEKKTLEANLEGYLRAILAARTGKSNFHMFYKGTDGSHFGPTSPYYDGECLLALVKAAKYLGHDHLWPHIKASAEAGWRRNVLRGLKIGEGKASAKKGEAESVENANKARIAFKRLVGYYQWGTMAWYELMGMEDPEFAKYARRTLRYGDFVLSETGVTGASNKGYAFEGLIPAFVTAVREGNKKLEGKFACAIRQGVENLHSLQVGHPKAHGLAEPLLKPGDSEKAGDRRAQGGAQGTRNSAALRIDTTQHQLHALLMARRLLQQQVLI